MEQIEPTLGQKIKTERKNRGLTQKDLAGEFITRTMLSKIENDFAKPSIKTIEYIAAKLDLPVTYFLKNMVSGNIQSKSNMESAFEHSCFLIKNKEYEKAITYIEDMLENNGHESEDIYYLRCIYNLTTCYANINKLDKTEQKALEILSPLKEKNDLYYVSKVYERIGFIKHRKDNYDLAKENHKQALKYLKESYVQDILYEQILNYNMGHCLYKMGNVDKALNYLENVRKLSKEYLCYYNAGNINMLLGLIYFEINDIDMAIKHTEKAVPYFDDGNNKHYMALCNKNLGNMYIKQGNYNKAISDLNKALGYFNIHKNEQKISEIKATIVDALSKQEKYEEAYNYSKEVNMENLDINDKAKYYIAISRYYIHKNQLEKAEEYLQKVIELTEDKYILYNCYTELARVRSLRGEYKKAYELSEKARKNYLEN